MKKILTVLFSLLLLYLLTVTVFSAGLTIDGKEPDLYIRNESDLVAFSEDIKNGKTFDGNLIVVMSNIDITADIFPIGDENHVFEGTFDGRGYYVSFTLSSAEDKSDEPTGFFAVIGENGVVRNLNVTGNVESTGMVGGVAGNNNGLIENCLIRTTVTGRSDSPAGFVCGENNGKVFNCFVLFRENEGKIVGSGEGEVEDSFNKNTPVNTSLQILKNNVSEHAEFVDWFWGWNSFPMFTREHGAHSFEKTDEIPATCRYSGQKKGSVCTVCGQIGSGCAVIQATGEHKIVHIERVEPTCTEPGHEEGEICADCGLVLSGLLEIEPCHADPEYVAEVPPTATEDGVSEGYICPRCGEKLDGFDPIPATCVIDTSDSTNETDDTDKTNKTDEAGDNEVEIGFIENVVSHVSDGVLNQYTVVFLMLGLGLFLMLLVMLPFFLGLIAVKKRMKNQK